MVVGARWGVEPRSPGSPGTALRPTPGAGRASRSLTGAVQAKAAGGPHPADSVLCNERLLELVAGTSWLS